MEEGLQEVRLNIFQRIRKMMYLTGMNKAKANKYTRLPDYLKNDDEVIDRVVAVSDIMIANVPVVKAAELIKNYPQLINNIYDINSIATIANIYPESCKVLEENALYNLVYNSNIKVDKQFIKYLSKEQQVKFLTEKSEYYELNSYNSGVQNPRHKSYGYPTNLDLKNFSDDAIISVALNDQKENEGRNISKKHILDMNYSNISIDTQIKLIMIDKEYMKKASSDAIKKYVGNNPLLIAEIPNKEIRNEILMSNPQLIKNMPSEIQASMVKNHIINYKDTYNIPYYRSLFNIREFTNPDDAKGRILSNQYNSNNWLYDDLKQITDIRDDDYIWEMAKFDPQFIRLFYADTASNLTGFKRNCAIANSMYIHANENDSNGKVTKFLEKYFKKINKYGNASIINESEIIKINSLRLFLTNDDVMNTISQNEIMDYIEKPEYDKLIEIIRKTYGDRSAKILEDRPGLAQSNTGNSYKDVSTIPNLYMFKPEIIDEFGIGAIHSALSYNMNTPAVLSELARKPEEFKKYKIFNKITDGIFNDTAIDLDKKLITFMNSKELFSDIERYNLTLDQIDNLKLAISDLFSKNDQKVCSFPISMKELDGYKEKRDKIYDEAISKSNNSEQIKEYMSQRYFGLNYKSDGGHISYLKDNSLRDMCRFYNLSEFVKNPELIENGKFSQDDLDVLELMDIINSISDPKILKEIASNLQSKEQVVNPLVVKSLKEKVPMQYSKDVMDSLLTPEKAEELVKNGTPGIAIEEIGGIKIIKLSGSKFKAYVTNPYLNNSNVKNVSNEIEAIQNWKEFENGVSTFSGCLIDQNENTSCISHGGNGLGFFHVNPNQVVGMGSTDIHVSHDVRRLEPITTENTVIQYDYVDDLMDKTSERLNGNDPYKDSFHKYNEIASLRREEKLSDIKEGTYGGKIMPDYLYTVGKNTGVSLVENAKKMGLSYIVEVDDEAYIGRAYSRQLNDSSKKDMKKHEDSKLITDVKSKINGDDGDGRE